MLLQVSGATAGGQAGAEVAVAAAVSEALAECERLGREIFGDTGACVAKAAGEGVATELALRLGRELGSVAGSEAGAAAGGLAGHEAGKAEAMKHNGFNMSESAVQQLHQQIRWYFKEENFFLSFVSLELLALRLGLRREK